MKIEDLLKQRSENKCELCESTDKLSVYYLTPAEANDKEKAIYICEKCIAQIDKKEVLDPEHWNVLSTSMWSEIPAVQIASWRMLNRLKNESWAQDLLDMLYLDDDNLAYAKLAGDHELSADVEFHKDANGAMLQTGDTVVLTKSLDVKGTSLRAPVGTVVKNIRLVHDNVEQIEGKVEGQTIIILTKYLRKQN